MLGKQTLSDRPTNDGAACAGAARKKRANKDRKVDVTVILFVRETSYAGHPRIYTFSANGAVACTYRTRIANDLPRGWRRLIGTR